jgi:type II secretory pathway pseudopilin PulG
MSSPPPRRQRQRGEILLFTLVALLLCLVGLIFAMRDTIITTLVTGNNLAKQKNAQANDIALKLIQSHIDAVVTGTGMDLPFSATGEGWYRAIDPDAAPQPPTPDADYWAKCTPTGDTRQRCSTEPLPGTGRNAKFVVQPTGRGDDLGCPVKDGSLLLTAVYYDVFIYVEEASQATSATTHTEYKICAQKT